MSAVTDQHVEKKMKKDARIYVAGHRGLVGSALVRSLSERGYNNLVVRSHAELDLEDQSGVVAFFSKAEPEYVFLAAAKVGGILANDSFPADFICSNLAIQNNVIRAAWNSRVRRLLFLGSSCIYPRECPQPIREKYLLTGPLEKTNRAYAVAKIAGIEMCHAFNRQHGTSFLSVMPTNLFGPDDNFDLETSHVLPALIRKFHLGKLAGCGQWEAIENDQRVFGPIPDYVFDDLAAISMHRGHPVPAKVAGIAGNVTPRFAVTLWGTGAPRREFLHVDDLADACVTLMSLEDDTYAEMLHHPDGPLINIGCGEDHTIGELARLVCRVVGFEGQVRFDPARPDGTPRKLLDVSRLSALGWKPKISLEAGVDMTYRAYRRKSGYSE